MNLLNETHQSGPSPCYQSRFWFPPIDRNWNFQKEPSIPPPGQPVSTLQMESFSFPIFSRRLVLANNAICLEQRIRVRVPFNHQKDLLPQSATVFLSPCCLTLGSLYSTRFSKIIKKSHQTHNPSNRYKYSLTGPRVKRRNWVNEIGFTSKVHAEDKAKEGILSFCSIIIIVIGFDIGSRL